MQRNAARPDGEPSGTSGTTATLVHQLQEEYAVHSPFPLVRARYASADSGPSSSAETLSLVTEDLAMFHEIQEAGRRQIKVSGEECELLFVALHPIAEPLDV